MQKYSKLGGMYLGHVRRVSLKEVHFGPIEGPFCGTVTFWENVSWCNFYSTAIKMGMVIVCCLIMSMCRSGPDRTRGL